MSKVTKIEGRLENGQIVEFTPDQIEQMRIEQFTSITIHEEMSLQEFKELKLE